jgi:hypothetical protein
MGGLGSQSDAALERKGMLYFSKTKELLGFDIHHKRERSILLFILDYGLARLVSINN